MFRDLSIFWNKYGFEILLILSVLIIMLNYYYTKGKRGTWDSPYTRHIQIYKTKPLTRSRSPSKESKGEVECRRVLENIFNEPFAKARPTILRNSVTSDDSGSDFNLELDCYNARLKIACEYNGIQHYKFTPYFHRNKDAFQNQKYRDYMKRDLCMKNNITLIEVPYTVKLENIQNFIITKLLQSGYKI